MPPPRRTLSERFWEKVDKQGPIPAHRPELGPCWLWTAGVTPKGYGFIQPEGRRSGPTLRAHRVAAEMAGMEIARRVVRHACDNPPCVNPAHLLVGTQRENVRDMIDRGRGIIGSTNGSAKLTDEQVLEIRAKLADGIPIKALVGEYGVTKQTVSAIKTAARWRHLTTEPVIVPVRERYTVILCACGCGAELTTPDRWGSPRRWLRGHSQRGAVA